MMNKIIFLCVLLMIATLLVSEKTPISLIGKLWIARLKLIEGKLNSSRFIEEGNESVSNISDRSRFYEYFVNVDMLSVPYVINTAIENITKTIAAANKSADVASKCLESGTRNINSAHNAYRLRIDRCVASEYQLYDLGLEELKGTLQEIENMIYTIDGDCTVNHPGSEEKIWNCFNRQDSQLQTELGNLKKSVNVFFKKGKKFERDDSYCEPEIRKTLILFLENAKTEAVECLKK